jgi:hypothetical protein
MAECIGEFMFLDGEWWQRDYYYVVAGIGNCWECVAGEYRVEIMD